MKLINSLPENDSPSLFNLPVNINNILQQTQSQQVINKIKMMVSIIYIYIFNINYQNLL